MASKAYAAQGPTGEFSGVPKMQQRITDPKTGIMDVSWWRFFQILAGAPQQESNVVLGASPTAYTATSDSQILISGGTGVSLQLTRKNTYNLPSTIGYFPVSDGDILTITYATPPTVTIFPC